MNHMKYQYQWKTTKDKSYAAYALTNWSGLAHWNRNRTKTICKHAYE